jgi:hypothetical protein
MHHRLVLTTLAAIASLVAPLHAASVLRLNEIGTARFVERAPGEIWLERGLLSALGGFRITDESPVLVSVPVPDDAKNKMLIQLEAWFAYRRLGAEATVNFVADEQSVPYTIGARQYLPVAASPDPKVEDGRLINISTRGRASASEKLIGGFVVDDQHRWVLIRAVGPGLAAFGVADAMNDPYLTLFKGKTPFYYNDDWSKRPDAGEIAAAADRVGAFPLGLGSKDAALLVQLPPGAYTAHVEPESGEAGIVMLEIYSIPSA